MADYQTTYVFSAKFEGQKALEDLRAFREQALKEMGDIKGPSIAGDTGEISSLTAAVREQSTLLTAAIREWREYATALNQAATAADKAGSSIASVSEQTKQTVSVSGRAPQAIAPQQLELFDPTQLQERYTRQMFPGGEAAQGQLGLVPQYLFGDPARTEEVFRAQETRLAQYNTALGEVKQSLTEPAQQGTYQLPLLTGEQLLTNIYGDPEEIRKSGKAHEDAVRALRQNVDELEPARSRLQLFNDAVREQTGELWALRRAAYGLESFGHSITRAGLAWTAAMGGMAAAYVNFDKAATQAAIAVELNSNLQDEFRKKLLDTSIEMAALPVEQLAAGIREWGLGTGQVIRSQADMNSMFEKTSIIQKAAILDNSNYETSIKSIGSVVATYAQQGYDVVGVTETLFAASADSFASLESLGQSMAMTAAVAAQLGIPLEDLSASLVILSSSGIEATMAGRALRAMFARLADPVPETQRALQDLTESVYGMGTSWRSVVFPEGEFMGFPKFLDFLAEALKNATTEQKAYYLSALATQNALPTLTLLVERQAEAMQYETNIISGWSKLRSGITDAETEGYRKFQEAMSGMPVSLGTAHEIMTERWSAYMESDNQRVERMKRIWSAAFITIGGTVTDAVLPYLEQLTDEFKAFADLLAEGNIWAYFIKDATAAALVMGTLVTVTGSLVKNWTNLAIIWKGMQAAGTLDLLKGGAAATSALYPAAAAAKVTAGTVAATIGTTVFVAGMAAAVVASIGNAIVDAERAREQKELVGEIERLEISPAAQAAFAEMFRPSSKFAQLAFEQRQVPTDVAGPAVLAKALPETNRLSEFVRLMSQLLNVDELFIERDVKLADAFARFAKLEGIPRTTINSVEDYVRVLKWLDEQAKKSADRLGDLSEAALRAELKDIRLGTPEITQVREDWLSKEAKEQEELNRMIFDYALRRQEIMQNTEDQIFRIQENYAEWERSAVEKKERDIANLEKQYNADSIQRADDHQRALMQRREDYLRSVFRTEQSYARSVALAEEDHQRSMAESEEDFNRRMEKMQRDRRSNLIDLLEARDVRGLVKLMRDSRKGISDAQEQFNIARKKDEENFRRQQARRAEEYEIQRNQREEDYRLQNERAAEQYARETAQRKIAFDEQKQAIKDALDEQIAARFAAATKEEEEAQAERDKRLDKLKIDLGLQKGEWDALQGYLAEDLYPTMLRDMDAFFTDAQKAWLAYAQGVQAIWNLTLGMAGSSGEPDPMGAPPLGGLRYRQSGGYADAGIYELGEQGREFVLNADTTRQLERRYGMLTQNAFMGNAGVNITFSPSYSGMGTEDRSWYRAAAREEASQLLAQVTKQKRGVR